jgi:hypothetical protein
MSQGTHYLELVYLQPTSRRGGHSRYPAPQKARTQASMIVPHMVLQATCKRTFRTDSFIHQPQFFNAPNLQPCGEFGGSILSLPRRFQRDFTICFYMNLPVVLSLHYCFRL